MKKTSLVIMAALSMLFTQCKKSEAESPSDDKLVNITLNVGGNSKIDVNTDSGAVTFEVGDKIYVASDGKYVGTLTAENGTKFSGTIANPIEGKPLYFYFLGNKTPNEVLTEGTTDKLTINISDQSKGLPVISGAPSTENYSSNVTNYKSCLLNKCALVKFDVSNYTGSGTVGIKGMNNQVTVALNNDSFSYDMINDGKIILNQNKNGNGEYWAILLPQDAVENGEAYSSDGWTGNNVTVPEIAINGYLTEGIAVNMTPPAFTVDANGTKVKFAPGNLWYDGSNFHFESNQWDTYPSAANQSDGTIAYSSSHVSHFKWSNVQNAVTSDDNYSGDLFCSNNFTVTDDSHTDWRTLSKDEWVYLLNTDGNSGRAAANRFAKGRVNSCNGLLIFPDGYTLPSEYTANGGQGMGKVNNKDNESYPEISIETNTWTNMENSGVVFLPATGGRVNSNVQNVGSYGIYWSSTFPDNTNAYNLGFGPGGVGPQNKAERKFGYSVRLVR